MANTARGGNLDKEPVASVATWHYSRDGGKTRTTQWVIEEHPVTLFLNGKEMVTLLCAGHHLDELAVGFFHAEGFIDAPQDLGEVRVHPQEGKVEVETKQDLAYQHNLWSKRIVTSGCGKGTVFYNALDALLSRPVTSTIQVTPTAIRNRMADLNQLSQIYRRTHGVHNTALATSDRIIIFRDDIGRHNAVDMMAGHAFLQEMDLSDKMLLTTGRLTSEILIKAAKVHLPVLVSRNTATTLAIELAKTLQITLIGYVRAGNFTVYTGIDRIREPNPEQTDE